MNNLYITDVVKHLIIINVLVFIGTKFMGEPVGGMEITDLNELGRLKFAVFYPTSPFFRSYQVVTYMFMHANVAHIFFNMYALYMFGTAMETVWGSKKFLFYYLFTGFGALGLQTPTCSCSAAGAAASHGRRARCRTSRSSSNACWPGRQCKRFSRSSNWPRHWSDMHRHCAA